MKKYKNIIFAVVCIFIIILLYVLGFRITYNPEIINEWDAVSGCAAWASVFVSGLAIYYAIQVPKKIAEDQNKIALFEKRYLALQKVGVQISDIDKIKVTVSDMISPRKLRKGFFKSIDNCKESILKMLKNTDGMYQYLFNEYLYNRIKYIHSTCEYLYVKILEIEGLVCQQEYMSITDKQWYSIISKDKSVTSLQREILDICDSVLSLEKDICKEAGKCMDLRKL